jgi:hypothetical protein
MIIIGIVLIWAFILIPILILILSMITFGKIWKMFKVYIFKIDKRHPIDVKKLIVYVHSKGGAISENCMYMIDDREIIDRDLEIRDNYIWIMKGISITSYSMVFLLSLAIDEYLYSFLNFGLVLLFWGFFSVIIIIGFSITMIFTYKQHLVTNRSKIY